MLGCTFGQIVKTNGSNLTVSPTPASFEIFINENTNMTLKIYNQGSVAKTLSSDVFILFTGNIGDDVQDTTGQKTLILYMTSTLGVASLKKWIAWSGSSLVSNTKIEIVCPANTYRGTMTSKDRIIEL